MRRKKVRRKKPKRSPSEDKWPNESLQGAEAEAELNTAKYWVKIESLVKPSLESIMAQAVIAANSDHPLLALECDDMPTLFRSAKLLSTINEVHPNLRVGIKFRSGEKAKRSAIDLFGSNGVGLDEIGKKIKEEAFRAKRAGNR